MWTKLPENRSRRELVTPLRGAATHRVRIAAGKAAN
jgi:hypothetical protein